MVTRRDLAAMRLALESLRRDALFPVGECVRSARTALALGDDAALALRCSGVIASSPMTAALPELKT